jgi:hypothetical protein
MEDRNTKHQTSNTRQLPNTKHQIGEPKFLNDAVGVWSIGVCLVFDVWCLVFLRASRAFATA